MCIRDRGYRVCVVNPMQVHAMRKLKSLSGVKNDRIDSWLIAETLRQGCLLYTSMQPPTRSCSSIVSPCAAW